MTYLLAFLGLCLFASFCVGLTDEILGYGICKRCGGKLVSQGWYGEKMKCPKCDGKSTFLMDEEIGEL